MKVLSKLRVQKAANATPNQSVEKTMTDIINVAKRTDTQNTCKETNKESNKITIYSLDSSACLNCFILSGGVGLDISVILAQCF